MYREMQESSKSRDHSQEQMVQSLTQHLQLMQEEMRQEQHEHEERLNEEHEQQEKNYRKVRWFAVPGVILGIMALVYMVKVVDVMETAMTQMSHNTDQMSANMVTINQTMATM